MNNSFLKGCLLVLIGAITALWIRSILDWNRLSPIDESIRRLRTGDLMIRVVDSNWQPIVGAKVKLEQTSHYFEFGTALSSQMFGDRVNPADQARYWQLVRQLFNGSVHENALKWNETQPESSPANYAQSDRILTWSQRYGLKMRGHTLFWGDRRWLQSWLQQLSTSELRNAVEQRASEVCSRYQGRILEYDVLNEMLHSNFFRNRLGETIVDDMFGWCQTADPTARLYVNDFNILSGEDLEAYISQIHSLLDRGVPLGGIGIQGHIREDISPEQIQQSLDKLAQFGLPLKITEFDAVVDTEQEQARILTDVYRVAFAHPAVTGIYMWGFWEGAHWEPKAALFRKNFEPKPAAEAYRDLVYKQWWTRAKSKTNRRGKFKTRAFYGKYRVTVVLGKQKFEENITFSPPGQQSQAHIIVIR